MVLTDPGDWVPDLVADFAFHRAVLQTVQFGPEPMSWVLKTPGHIIFLDELYAAYPDARMVMTHRDPARTMPSTVSTTAMAQWLRSDALDLDGLADLVGATFTGALNEVAARHRDGRLPDAFGAAPFAAMMADPVATVRSLYDHIGQELTPDHATAIDRYLADKPRGKFGVHRYGAEEWGFDAERLRTELAPYIDEFDVALERA